MINTLLISVLLFGISGGEVILILLLVLIFFGPKKIPEIARTIGKGINEVKKVQRDINAEIHRYADDMENPAKEIKEDIEGFSKGLDDEDTSKTDTSLSDDAKTRESDSENSPSDPQDDPDSNDDLPYPYNQKDEPQEPLKDDHAEQKDDR